MSTRTRPPQYRCDSCGYTRAESQFPYAKDLHQRLSPGGLYTDRECPKTDCGALAFPVQPSRQVRKPHTLHRDTVIVSLTDAMNAMQDDPEFNDVDTTALMETAISEALELLTGTKRTTRRRDRAVSTRHRPSNQPSGPS